MKKDSIMFFMYRRGVVFDMNCFQKYINFVKKLLRVVLKTSNSFLIFP